jgi:hypothetical protein
VEQQRNNRGTTEEQQRNNRGTTVYPISRCNGISCRGVGGVGGGVGGVGGGGIGVGGARFAAGKKFCS